MYYYYELYDFFICLRSEYGGYILNLVICKDLFRHHDEHVQSGENFTNLLEVSVYWAFSGLITISIFNRILVMYQHN